MFAQRKELQQLRGAGHVPSLTGMKKVIAFMDNPPPTVKSGTFQEVLSEWGHTWMWEGLKLSGKDGDDTGTWLSTANRNNTLVAVTDGSYMKASTLT